MGVKLPNVLTGSRIVLAPFVYYAGIARERELFAILFAIVGLTDALDGFFARYLDMKSGWGSTFDTIADIIFYPSGLMLYFFMPAVITDHWQLIIVGLAVFAGAVLIAWLRGRLQIPHLFSAKTFAVFMYLFVIYTVLIGYSEPFFYTTAAVGIFAAVEQFIVLSFRKPSASRRWWWE